MRNELSKVRASVLDGLCESSVVVRFVVVPAERPDNDAVIDGQRHALAVWGANVRLDLVLEGERHAVVSIMPSGTRPWSIATLS